LGYPICIKNNVQITHEDVTEDIYIKGTKYLLSLTSYDLMIFITKKMKIKKKIINSLKEFFIVSYGSNSITMSNNKNIFYFLFYINFILLCLKKDNSFFFFFFNFKILLNNRIFFNIIFN